MTNPPVDVQQYGQSIWLDFIHRNSLENGEMQKYIDEFGVIGVTSNPAIFQKAIGESDTYDSSISELLKMDAYNIYEKLAVEDIQHALDLFRPIYDRTNKHDGYVSLEVSPLIANDTATTTSEALRLFKLVNRPNLMIKIPATPAGLPAIEEAIAQGVNVNVTLIFSVENYEQVAMAFIRGLERRLASGGDVSHIASVASFFLSRIDVMIDRMLENNIRSAQGRDLEVVARNRELLGKAAIANAKLAYKRFMELFYGERFAKLRAAGAQVQRPLWASTGSKNPAYPDTIYVDSLIGKDTVNTVPPATLKAFKDHGTAADTLATGLDTVEHTMSALAHAGIDMGHVTNQLQADGVALFVEAFENLLKQVEAKRDVLEAGVINKQNLALGIHGDAVQTAIAKMASDKVNARIWGRDGSVWKDQSNAINKIGARLGWLDLDKTLDYERLKMLQASVKNGAYSHVLLLGMGGSSLTPDVLYRTFGQQPGFPQFHMLDSTDPDYIREIESRIDIKQTLFIVSSKSGSIETQMFARYFYAKAGNNGNQFIAITDVGSTLEAEARANGYRDIFLNPADISGSYSALSYVGMVPAALMGLDLNQFTAERDRMIKACSTIIPEQQHPGIWLGAILGIVTQQGRDKVTIHTSAGITALGDWIEGLIAESTGKEGKGILPVVGATIGNPHDYSSDRLFVYIRVDGDPSDEEMDAGIRALREAGHPRITLYLPNKYALAGEFFRWEFATAVAGKVLEINPFDEPNVKESKENTARLLTYYKNHSGLPSSEHAFQEGNMELYADEKMLRLLSELCLQHNYNAGDLTGMLASFINSTMAGDYFSLQAYLPMNMEIKSALEELRRRLRHTTRRAVTVGFGPRFLHSIGQLHKGGPNSGNFIQLTCDDDHDLDIPGEDFTFGVLKAAQADGDLAALRAKERRAIRLHISGDILKGLDILMKAIDLVDERRK